MNHRRLFALASIAVSSTLAIAPAAGAAVPNDHPAATTATPQPTAAARAASITKAGEAHMGWSRPRTPSTAKPAAASAAKSTATPYAALALPSVAVYGIDVYSGQGNVNWASWWKQGKRFVWVKATEGTSYTNPYFGSQYSGSYRQGFVRGGYHFALPDRSTAAAQANYFSSHGGGWSGDRRTLPGALDIEWNPYGATCYGKSKAAMASWIRSFSNTYKARWHKYPIIYTAWSWWNQCVGNTSFASTNPLWVARYASSAGVLPYNWRYYTVWQYSSSPIDQNVFNGSMSQLVTFATKRD